MTASVHATAEVEDGAVVGEGTAVWAWAHVRTGAVIGSDCIIGGGTTVAPGVVVGDRVKINSQVYLCSGVTVEDGVMLAAHVVFTNDRHPRASTPDLTRLRSSEVDEHTEATLVREGATVGAAAVVGPGLTLGRFSMVAMGAVVTRDVPDFHLVAGVPATSVAVVCRCGPPLLRLDADSARPSGTYACAACGRRYQVDDGRVTELDG